MSFDNTGWTFADGNSIDWQEMAPGVSMKVLAPAGGRIIATFKFEPGYEGGVHQHADAEFTYVLEGSIVSNGVLMEAGHAYGVEAGTTHEEFRTDTGATVVSVFQPAG